MAAAMNGDLNENVCNQNNLNNSINGTNNTILSHSNCKDPQDEFMSSWGFNVDELYILAATFLKEKEGKAFHITYKDKLSLVAFSKQVAHGKFIEEKSPPVGYLDVIGRDRRQAWQTLGDMSQRDAKAGFINLLNNICPLFRPFVLAHKCDLEEKERRRLEEEERKRQEAEEEEQMRLEEEQQRLEEERRLKQEKERQKQSQQKRLIQEALNRQTFHQFKAYAEKQFPGDPEQAVLIRQLQEQHYQQYMQQVLQEQLSPSQNHKTNSIKMAEQENTVEPVRESTPEVSEEEICDPLPVAAAHMWTRKDIVEFKEAIRKEGGDGIIKVGHGETVTVRVPTHDDGTCLFWEFATDSYDLGFGVYFEWTRSPDSQVTVHISESEEEEDDDEDLDTGRNDIEKGVTLSDKPPLSVVIPVYRRDCHEEVYAGSHNYPGQGVYLLKFDNSYSLWRSKTLYYRVYYTR
ncbi:Golgi resident protein GCP60-like isoform X2 [Argiope bruennichi]|uniref:Golgi resident protein GCP60-like isoform X2 n=1 Tax=Argiope bruennichi TaxID=94029 RepID=UPI002494EB6A|nr:Golgi resident protein GCP60-like isoform X2 [Argiope bruennichi]